MFSRRASVVRHQNPGDPPNAATIWMQFLCVGFFLSHPPAFRCFIGSHLQYLPSYNNITAKGRMVTVMGKNQTT
jgi:hypothetical protein